MFDTYVRLINYLTMYDALYPEKTTLNALHDKIPNSRPNRMTVGKQFFNVFSLILETFGTN